MIIYAVDIYINSDYSTLVVIYFWSLPLIVGDDIRDRCLKVFRIKELHLK